MKKIKSICLVLVLSLLLSNIFAYAEGVNDISEDDWSEPYVSAVVSSDIMPLYEGDFFKPQEKVTKMEVLNVIYNLAILKKDVTIEEVDEYVLKYQNNFDGLLIPEIQKPYGADNHKALAYALEKGILRTSELSFIFKNGSFSVVNKVDASVYMGKALNIYLKENVNKFYEIRFKDGGEITLMAWPYINFLIEKEIISKEGSEGYFYPNSTMNRDVLSVYATGLLNELLYFKPGENDSILDPSKTVLANGKISIIHYDKKIIEIRNNQNILEVYDAVDAKFTLNGQEITIRNLESGVDVKIKTNGRNLVSLEVVQEFDVINGTFTDLSAQRVLKGESIRVVEVKTNDGYKYYKSLNSLVVIRDFKSSSIEKLQIGDMVKVYYQGLYVKKIEAYSQKVVIDGILQRSSNFKRGDVVSIKLSNGALLEQTLKDDIVLTNMIEDAIKGDIVKVTLSSGLIIEVEATGLSSEASGRITEIIISTNPEVTILNSKGNSRKYSISEDVIVKNLGIEDSMGLYALRLDQDVTFELNGVLVDIISINKAVKKAQFKAEITEIHRNINIVKAKDENNKIWFISLEAAEQNISDFVVGDSVYIYGVELSNDLFEADLIIILE